MCETVEDPDVSVSGGRQSVMLMPAAVVSVSVSRMRILTLQMLIPSHLSRAPRSGARAGGVKRGIAPHCAARATIVQRCGTGHRRLPSPGFRSNQKLIMPPLWSLILTQ